MWCGVSWGWVLGAVEGVLGGAVVGAMGWVLGAAEGAVGGVVWCAVGVGAGSRGGGGWWGGVGCRGGGCWEPRRAKISWSNHPPAARLLCVSYHV